MLHSLSYAQSSRAQSQLGVMTRVQSVSSYAVNACAQRLLSCGRTAVDSLSLNASTLASRVEPYADAAIVSMPYPNAVSSVAFSASMDPGVYLALSYV